MTDTGRPAGPVLVAERHFTREDLPGLRAFVSAQASRAGASSEQAEVLVLVASELAANAVLHGGGSGRLRLWRGNAHIVCEVADSGPGLASDAGTHRPSTESYGGRGLWLVRQLADDVEITSGPSGATVAAWLAVRARRGIPSGGAHRPA